MKDKVIEVGKMPYFRKGELLRINSTGWSIVTNARRDDDMSTTITVFKLSKWKMIRFFQIKFFRIKNYFSNEH